MALEDIIGLTRWSPSEAPRDVDLRYTLVLSRIEGDPLLRVLALRLQFLTEAALTAIGDDPPPSLSSIRASLVRVRDEVEALGIDPAAGHARTVREDLEMHAMGILEDRERLTGLYRELENPRSLAAEAHRRILHALSPEEPVPLNALREAAELLREHFTDQRNQADAFAWLELAWTKARLGHGPADVEQALRQCAVYSWRDHSILTHLAHRMLCDAQCRLADRDLAAATALKALDVRTDADALFDGARAALRSGHLDLALSRAQAGMKARQTMLAEIMADPDLADLRAVIGDATAQMRQQARETYGEAMRVWAANLEKVAAAEAAIGQKIDLPGPLRARAEVAHLAEQDDFLGVVQAEEAARERSAETLEWARRALNQIVAEQEHGITEIEAEADLAWKQREAVREEAQDRRSALEHAERQAVNAQLPSPERMQQGCGAGLGCGCLAFAGYLIAIFLGVGVGPETTVGKLILGVAVLPVAAAALAQVGLSIRRSALEAELARKIEQARQEYERVLAGADAAYKRKVAPVRERLDAAKAGAGKFRDAMALLETDDPTAV